MLQRESYSANKAHSDSETYEWLLLPEWGHDTMTACPPALPKWRRADWKLPTGLRNAGDESGGSEFAEGDTGNLKPAEKCAAATGDAAAVDKPCWACIAGKLSERGVVFFSLQFRAESRIFFNCFLFALVALEPCCFCHKGRAQ